MSQFKSVYTSIKIRKSGNNGENNSKSLSHVFTGSPTTSVSQLHIQDAAFAPSTMTKVLAKKDHTISTKDLKDLLDKGITIFLQNSQQGTQKLISKTLLLHRRYEKLEMIMAGLKDSEVGVPFVPRKKFLDHTLPAATNYDISEWIFKNCSCFSIVEVKRMFQILLDHGYLIPLDLSQTKVSEDPEVLYACQADYFYPSQYWEASEVDYGIHLLRRSGKTGGQMMLSKTEIERFYKIQKELVSEWKKIVQGSEKQKAYLQSLEKKDRKLMELREAAFWKVQRPQGSVPAVFENLQLDMKLQRKEFNEEEYYDFLSVSSSPKDTLDYLTEKIKYLTYQDTIVRKDVSAAAKNLIKHTRMWEPLDPLLVPSPDNVWTNETVASHSEPSSGPSTEMSIEVKPKAAQVAMWLSSFKDMLNDPLGVKYFRRFLEKDLSIENLEFYLACHVFQALHSREEFYERAEQIFNEFIATGSPKEINIDSTIRKAITEKIVYSDKNNLPLDLYTTAAEHCFTLMQTSSYPRFCASEEMKELQASLEKPDRLNVGILGESRASLATFGSNSDSDYPRSRTASAINEKSKAGTSSSLYRALTSDVQRAAASMERFMNKRSLNNSSSITRSSSSDSYAATAGTSLSNLAVVPNDKRKGSQLAGDAQSAQTRSSSDLKREFQSSSSLAMSERSKGASHHEPQQ